MSCEHTRTLIHAYLDGELDLVRAIEIEDHLSECPACTLEHDNYRALSSAMRNGSLYYPMPADLPGRVHAALAESVPAEIRTRTLPRRRWIQLGGIAASLAFLAVLTWLLGPVLSRPRPNDLLTRDIVSDHVRSLMANHLTDVLSSDQHTVKPWFRGKLDFSPQVKDLSKQGFTLVGGRLDYIQDKPVSALVYQRRQHVINLFVWPSTQEGDQGVKKIASRGYNLMNWVKSGMVYWAVSDLNDRELQEFILLVQN